MMIDRKDYNRRLIEEFRANTGKVAGAWAMPLLLLTTTSVKSGELRTTPMRYLPDDDRLLVIASNLGVPAHPDWYYNLLAHPQVTVEVGPETFDAIADLVEGEERQRLWTRIVALHPFFAEHQAKTTRQIPVLALSRREG
jgi:deazaflavin-dependent oxidoreductase (nitroreductase family)